MDVTPENLKLIFQSARVLFDEGVSSTRTTLLDNCTMKTTSTTAEELYGFLDRVPKLRKWLGPRQVNNLIAQAYKLKNEKFEDTIGIAREHVEDDKIGLYSQRFKRLGQQSKKWPEYLVRDKLQAGKTELCFDGKAFFATDHWQNYGKKSGSQANLFTNKALSRANFVAVYQAMLALKGADGEPLDDFGDEVCLLVDPSNAETAHQICQGELTVLTAGDGAVTNVVKKWARPVVCSTLANEPGVWYLCDTAGERPLIFQERYAPDLILRTNPDDPHVFDMDEFLMGTRARGVAGFGLWWKMARVEPT